MTEKQPSNPQQGSAHISDVLITREWDHDVFRGFSADIEFPSSIGPAISVGSIRGQIGWHVEELTLWDVADEVSSEADMLSWAADEIVWSVGDDRDAYVETVVKVEMIELEPQFRGQRLTQLIIDELIDVLSLKPSTTLIVLQPEPQKVGGGPMPEGPDRDDALARLRRAYEDQGFQRLGETVVWWRLAAG